MVEVNILVAFVSGVTSFFAPCVLPLLPSYVAFVTGTTLEEVKYSKSYSMTKSILPGIAYILGFSIIFVALGTGAAGIGIFLRLHTRLIQQIAGIVMVALGLQFAGIVNIPFLNYSFHKNLPRFAQKPGVARSFLLGVFFASLWTPCIGAILGSILALAAVSETVWQGATLLFFYSLGISLPFVVVALSLASAPTYLKLIKTYARKLSLIVGLGMAFFGLLLITGYYSRFNAWLFQIAFRLGYEIK